MRLISKQELTTERVTGRLSDGSDRDVVEFTEWVVHVDDDGRDTVVSFDHDPTATEIIDAVLRQTPSEIVGTTKATIEPGLRAKFDEWQRWKLTAAEATARGLPAGVISALGNKTDAAWAAYLAAITAWRAAP